MVIRHKLLHIFLGLYVFYVLFLLVSVVVYLLSQSPDLVFTVLGNRHIWMLYGTKPLFIGMIGSLVSAFIVQWCYQCRVEGDDVHARNALGKKVAFSKGDVQKTMQFNIPLMPLTRLSVKGQGWGVWVPSEANLLPSSAS